MKPEPQAHYQPAITPTPAAFSPLVEKENDVLNVREAARLLRIHPDNLTRLARQGKVPHGVLGGRYRFSRHALLDFLSQPDRTGPIKSVRKLADYPPAKLIARVQKLGGNLVVVRGRLVLEGLSREQIGKKLWDAITAKVNQIIAELNRPNTPPCVSVWEKGGVLIGFPHFEHPLRCLWRHR